LRNPTQRIAFCVRLMLLRADGSTRVLPAFYSDNYLTLFPGQEQRVRVTWNESSGAGEAPGASADRGAPRLWVTGWNVARGEVR